MSSNKWSNKLVNEFIGDALVNLKGLYKVDEMVEREGERKNIPGTPEWHLSEEIRIDSKISFGWWGFFFGCVCPRIV